MLNRKFFSSVVGMIGIFSPYPVACGNAWDLFVSQAVVLIVLKMLEELHRYMLVFLDQCVSSCLSVYNHHEVYMHNACASSSQVEFHDWSFVFSFKNFKKIKNNLKKKKKKTQQINLSSLIEWKYVCFFLLCISLKHMKDDNDI